MASDEAIPTARPRAGDLALFLLLLGLLTLGGSLLHASLERGHSQQHSDRRQLVQELGLTGLALFTEARYTRHPELSDRHAPFQNHPLTLEHFPSGTLVPPPRHLHE